MTTVPTGAKRPSDRRKPATAKTLTVEVAGHEWTIEPSVLDDFRFLGYLDELDEGNAARMPRLLKMLLGTEQYAAALDALSDNTGRVSIEVGAQFVSDIFEGLQQGN